MDRDPYAPPWGNDDEHVHDPNDYADAHVELDPVTFAQRVEESRRRHPANIVDPDDLVLDDEVVDVETDRL